MCKLVSKKVVEERLASYKIGSRIKLARKDMGYSQEKLAEKVDCTVATISSYETGRTVPDIDTIINMAGVLNVTVYWIIGLDEGMNSILYAISRILKLYSREQQRAVLNIFFIIDKYLMNR